MTISLTNKAIIGVDGSATLGGATYGVYSQFFATVNMKDGLLSKSKTPLNLDAKEG